MSFYSSAGHRSIGYASADYPSDGSANRFDTRHPSHVPPYLRAAVCALALTGSLQIRAEETVAASTDAQSQQLLTLDADSGRSEGGRIEKITVTARRRAENAQDVPIPIAALTGDALEGASQFRLEDLNQRLPSTNVQFGNPRQTSIAVRGLGNNPANDALESSVGVYLDNVYLGRPGMAIWT